jgi:glucose 1-dehydrogenase
MCRNGRYTEHGIKELDGFMRERYRLDPRYAVKMDPSLARTGVLLEPTSVVAKAWEQIERVAGRMVWRPRVVLVTGAGPIGLLAALLGVQRGLEVHVLDRISAGPKPRLVAELGATYHRHSGRRRTPRRHRHRMHWRRPTGLRRHGQGSARRHRLPDRPVGVGRTLTIDAAALNQELVLHNELVFGTVNANRRHYQAAAAALLKADQTWLEGLINRRVRLGEWADAMQRRPDDVKTVIDVTA